MNERKNVSLHLLFLNDLLRTNAIDQNIYDRAVRKLTTKTTAITEQPVRLATA